MKKGARGPTGPWGPGPRPTMEDVAPPAPDAAPPPDATFAAAARTGRGASHPACARVRGGRRRAGAGARCRRRRGHGALPRGCVHGGDPRASAEEPGDPRPSPKRARAPTRLPPRSPSRPPRPRAEHEADAATVKKPTVAKLRARPGRAGPGHERPQGGAPGAAPERDC